MKNQDILLLSVLLIAFSFACSVELASLEEPCQTASDCKDDQVCENGFCKDVEVQEGDGDFSEEDGDSGDTQPDGDKNESDGDDSDGDDADGDDADGDDADGDDVDGDDADADGDDADGDDADGDFDNALCEDVNCEQDENPCTEQVCDPADGKCKPRFIADGVCPESSNPCMEMVCVEDSLSCKDVPYDAGDCSDDNICNGSEYCEDGQCKHKDAIECPGCLVCDPEDGECVCPPEPCEAEELCNGMDDDCDGSTDEDNVCSNPDLGIRVELRWQRQNVNLDLHLMRPGAKFGTDYIVDKDDCYFSNPNPDWGVAGLSSDDPSYGDDISSGGGNNWDTMNPEMVHIGLPSDGPYRVVVHYASYVMVPVSTNLLLTVYIDGQVKKEMGVTFSSDGGFLNAVCINPETKTVSEIVNAEGANEIVTDYNSLNADACLSQGIACTSACGCPQGVDCIDGICKQGPSPAYCCKKPGCVPAKYCVGSENEGGYCGSLIAFDYDFHQQALGDKVNVETLYDTNGVVFYTDKQNAVVATDTSWELDGYSQGVCCSTMDKTTGKRWEGDIHVAFIRPNENGSVGSAPTVANFAAFAVGQTFQNGLRVRAYNKYGFDPNNHDTNKVYDAMIHNSGWVYVLPDEPMRHLWITQANDPDFVIDDLYFEALWIPEF